MEEFKKFNVGDIVTPKPAYKYSGILLKIIEIEIEENPFDYGIYYKLLPIDTTITPEIFNFFERTTWYASQLNLVVSSKNILGKVSTNDICNELNSKIECLKRPDDLCNIEVKECLEMINCDKILNLYEKRELVRINEKDKEERNEIMSQDVFYNLTKSYEKQFLELFKNEFKREFKKENECYYSLPIIYADETNQKLKELDTKTAAEINELHERIQEVETRLSIVNDYDEAVKILKKYNILDREGKING